MKRNGTGWDHPGQLDDLKPASAHRGVVAKQLDGFLRGHGEDGQTPVGGVLDGSGDEEMTGIVKVGEVGHVRILQCVRIGVTHRGCALSKHEQDGREVVEVHWRTIEATASQAGGTRDSLREPTLRRSQRSMICSSARASTALKLWAPTTTGSVAALSASSGLTGADPQHDQQWSSPESVRMDGSVAGVGPATFPPPDAQEAHLPYLFETVADTGVASFCEGSDDPTALHDQLAASLHAGSTRPDWCWLALDPTGMVLGRHYWWGQPDATHPMGVELVSVEDHAAATELLCHARTCLDVEDAWCCITAAVEEGDDPSAARRNFVDVLDGCDFGFEVSRVQVEWTARSETRPDSGRLDFRPARSLPDEVLVNLFSMVADSSLDHGMSTDRVLRGAEEAARHRLERARTYRAESDWFQVALTPAGDPVGYVVPGLADETPMVAEIGVAVGHRGHGYVDDLLGWATRLLASFGAERIIADTDRANVPMRAAFNRGGFREFRWRDDYQWKRGDR